jgi:hypothetical protein
MQKKPLYAYLILVPLAFLLHNLEESLTMVSFVQENIQRLPGPIRLLEEKLQLTQAYRRRPNYLSGEACFYPLRPSHQNKNAWRGVFHFRSANVIFIKHCSLQVWYI